MKCFAIRLWYAAFIGDNMFLIRYLVFTCDIPPHVACGLAKGLVRRDRDAARAAVVVWLGCILGLKSSCRWKPATVTANAPPFPMMPLGASEPPGCQQSSNVRRSLGGKTREDGARSETVLCGTRVIYSDNVVFTARGCFHRCDNITASITPPVKLASVWFGGRSRRNSNKSL